MLSTILLRWRLQKASVKGWFFKLLYGGKRVQIGKNFQCDTFPDVMLTQNGTVQIGDNVLFRRNVELRAHNDGHVHIASNVRIDRGVRILAANKAEITIETGARIGLYTVLNGGDSITIGEKCLISGYVYLQTSMHRYKGEGSIQEQGYDHAPVILEEDVWLGAHAVVLPGVTLGRGSIVGSNAVVNKSSENGDILGGVPAKILKSRS